MNHEEFCKRLNETPNEDFEGRDEQVASCPASAEYLREVQAFEARLKQALEVPAPDIALPNLAAAAAAEPAEFVQNDSAFDAMLKRALEVPVPDFAIPDLEIPSFANTAEDPAEGEEFELKLRQALEVDVPDFAIPDLSAAPADDNVVSLADRRPAAGGSANNRPMTWLAMAASIALAVIVGVQFLDQPAVTDTGRPELVAELLEHMTHEREQMRVKTTPASTATVRYVTSQAGSDVDQDIGLISYARSCVVNGETIPHLVLQGKNGPITLLIMPNEPVGKTIPFEDEDFHGAIVPVGETGSVAIIGRRGESLDNIRETIADKIRLSI